MKIKNLWLLWSFFFWFLFNGMVKVWGSVFVVHWQVTSFAPASCCKESDYRIDEYTGQRVSDGCETWATACYDKKKYAMEKSFSTRKEADEFIKQGETRKNTSYENSLFTDHLDSFTVTEQPYSVEIRGSTGTDPKWDEIPTTLEDRRQ